MLYRFIISLAMSLCIVVVGCRSTPVPPTPTPVPPTSTPLPPTPTPVPSEVEAPEAVGDKASAVPAKPIIIGAVFNATGWMSAYDQPPRQAALLAIEDINAQGGVLGRELELIELDGRTDPATVEDAARQLVARGAEILIAPCDFDVGAPVSQVAQEMGLVGISTCATSPLYGSLALGNKQFTVSMWSNIMGAAMAEYGFEELGWRRAYIVVETTIDYNLSLGEAFAEHFESLGGEIIGRDTYTTGEQDFSAHSKRIQALPEDPDVLYVSGIMPDLGVILQQIRGAGIETPIAGGDTYDDAELIASLGPELGNNLYMATHSWLGPEAGWEMTRFIQLYEAEYGQPPASSFIVMGWDTVQALAHAIGTAGTTEGAALAEAMEKIEFDMLSGNLSWTTAQEGHQPLKAAAIVEVQNGEASFLAWLRPESPPAP